MSFFVIFVTFVEFRDFGLVQRIWLSSEIMVEFRDWLSSETLVEFRDFG